jgi:nucleotide-binding universal stress UspA family protein
MYKNILLAVDGSAFGSGTIPYAMKLAKETGARITAVHVTRPRNEMAVGELGAFFMSDAYTKVAAQLAERVLETVKRAGAEAGVPLTAMLVEHVHPWEAIVRTADEQKCDLILMASHGRKGITGLLLGSETTKVLSHSKVPVLIWRA